MVSGVIVALAANDWAQRQREQRLVEDYTVRVIEDLDWIAGSLQVVIGWSRALESSGEVLLPVLERSAGAGGFRALRYRRVPGIENHATGPEPDRLP